MTAASPGVIATILLSAHYRSHEQYVMALAREMRKEYALIHARGLLLQVDCPDLAMERVRFFQNDSLEAFQRSVELHVEAINQATAGIPADRIRLHVCWGNYDGPHTHDVAARGGAAPPLPARGSAPCPCRWPTRATSTSTACSSAIRSPTPCSCCPG